MKAIGAIKHKTKSGKGTKPTKADRRKLTALRKFKQRNS